MALNQRFSFCHDEPCTCWRWILWLCLGSCLEGIQLSTNQRSFVEWWTNYAIWDVLWNNAKPQMLQGFILSMHHGHWHQEQWLCQTLTKHTRKRHERHTCWNCKQNSRMAHLCTISQQNLCLTRGICSVLNFFSYFSFCACDAANRTSLGPCVLGLFCG